MTAATFADAPNSGPAYDELYDDLMEWYQETYKYVKEARLAGGYPPGTEPLSPREQFDRLAAMRAAGDPAFTLDPQAQATYQRLAARFNAANQLPLGQPVQWPGGFRSPDSMEVV